MAFKTTYLVQPFELHRKRLRPACQESAQTEFGACKKAEAFSGRMAGAAALKIVAVPHLDEANLQINRLGVKLSRQATSLPRGPARPC